MTASGAYSSLSHLGFDHIQIVAERPADIQVSPDEGIDHGVKTQ